MKALLAALTISLTGCASQPMTPEQAAIFMQMQQNQQANNAAAWQNMQGNPLFQRMPTAPQYQAPVYQAPRQINCTTTGMGYALHTTCR